MLRAPWSCEKKNLKFLEGILWQESGAGEVGGNQTKYSAVLVCTLSSATDYVTSTESFNSLNLKSGTVQPERQRTAAFELRY